MKNGTKIRTMQDDLEDIKNDLANQSEQQKPALKATTKKTHKPVVQSNPIEPPKSEILQTASSNTQQPVKTDDGRSEIEEKASLSHSTSIPSGKPASEQNDKLKELIRKISNQTEKDSSDNKNEIEEKETVAAPIQTKENNTVIKEAKGVTEIINELNNKNGSKPSLKEEAKPKEILNDLAKETPADENTDDIDKLKKLIHRISEPKPSIEEKPESKIGDLESVKETKEDIAIKETVPSTRTESSIKQTQPTEELVKLVKKEQTGKEEITTPLAQKSEPKPSIEEKPESKIGDLESVKETKEDIAIKETVPLPQKPEPDVKQTQPAEELVKKEETGKEEITTPLAQRSELKPSTEEKPVKKEEATKPVTPVKKSFWGNISEKLKKSSDSEKINALSSKKKVSNIKTNNKAKEFASQSGVLQDNKSKKQKEESEKESLSKKAYYDKSYMAPNERLIHGKQKYYSSVSKRIKLREEKDEMEDLRDTAKIEKQKKIVTKEEEYKKLKKSIMQKYNIKLFSLPWKKIIPVAIIALMLTGSVSWYIISRIKPPEPPAPPMAIIGNEIEEFLNIENAITIAEEDLKGFNNLEANAMAIFNSNRNIKIIKLFIIYDKNETDKKMLSLQKALDAIGITDIEEGVNNLPNGFLQETTNNYNLFLFKTEKGTLRYGLAIKINNEQTISELMEEWEKEGSKNKKITTVLKPLFGDDRNFEEVFSPLSTATYRDVRIRYVSLTDQETALDYFIHKNTLVFATSKDSTFLMIDLLTSR